MVSEKKLQDLEGRINSAKEIIQQKEEPSQLSTYSPFKIIVDILSGIAVGVFLGYICDSYFGTLPLFLFLFAVFGMIGGIYNVYKDAKNLEEGK